MEQSKVNKAVTVYYRREVSWCAGCGARHLSLGTLCIYQSLNVAYGPRTVVLVCCALMYCNHWQQRRRAPLLYKTTACDCSLCDPLAIPGPGRLMIHNKQVQMVKPFQIRKIGWNRAQVLHTFLCLSLTLYAHGQCTVTHNYPPNS
jgi:hypothetical protein